MIKRLLSQVVLLSVCCLAGVVQTGAQCIGPMSVPIIGSGTGSALSAGEAHTDAPCAGGDGSVTISATGGTAPYSGTGTFPQMAGTQQYTVTDGAGCTATVTATVGMNSCLTISGQLIFMGDASTGVAQATVNLSGDASDIFTPTLPDGLYSLLAGAGSNFTITPSKSVNLINGISSVDAVAIQQHLVGLSKIPNFYRLVAADCNKNSAISSIDASIIKQALLGNPSALAILTGTGSWRFIPTTFDTLANPPTLITLPAFPETIDLTGVTSDQTGQDFWGIKTGDVTDNANPLLKPTDGVSVDPVIWTTQDYLLQAGETVEVNFAVNNFLDIAAWQFALQFDPAMLEFDHIESLTTQIQVDASGNFGLYNIAAGELRSVWTVAQGSTLNNGTKVFKVVFKALQGGQYLSELLHFHPAALPEIAYATDLSSREVKLEFLQKQTLGTGGAIAVAGVQLLQNQPNPFSDRTTIGFVLPEACAAELRILDMNGRLLQSRRAEYTAGRHEVIFELDDATATGLLYYELITPFGQLSRKMLANGR